MTFSLLWLFNFVFRVISARQLKNFKVISFTHKTTDISNIGKLHLEESERSFRLKALLQTGITELLYLSTCNRVEFLLYDSHTYNHKRLVAFFSAFNPQWDSEEVEWAIENSRVRVDKHAIHHLFRIASSLDSLVVGEREIITQVRKSFDECNELGLTGDFLRLVVNKTIECAKAVYTETEIARNPVSIVSLAYRSLRELNLKNDSRILVVGAGETNSTMCKFLNKHGFQNFTVANRTFEKAAHLAKQLNGKAISLADLKKLDTGFDLLVTCTGSSDPIFTKDVYANILKGEKDRKCIIDLAIPTDVDAEVIRNFAIHYIEINSLKERSNANLAARAKEIENCESIIEQYLAAFDEQLQQRKVEIAMKAVPQKVRDIKTKALEEVFCKELDQLDDKSRDVLEKMMAYIEKKYISVPMKMAKDIMLKKS